MRVVVALPVISLLFLALVPALSAREFFGDDFEGYVTTEDLTELGEWQIFEVNDPVETNASWRLSLDNGCGRGNPPGENGAPSFGNYVVSDSDCGEKLSDGTGTGRSHDLWSPTFNTAGSEVVWLHMNCTAQMNNNGTVVFDIEVSTDSGGSWTNVFRRVAPSRGVEPIASATNADGFFGRLHVDLSAVARNQPSVMVRVRQFEPDCDWWIAFDDFLVDDVAPPLGGEVALLSEALSGGIPAQWTIRSAVDPPLEGVETWNTQDPCKRSVERYNPGKLNHLDGRGVGRLGRDFAIQDSACAPNPPKNEYLITPAINCTDANEVYLHYKSEIVFSAAATQEVLLSLDGGDTFEPEPIFSYNAGGGLVGGEEPFYAERIFKIDAAIAQPAVAFAFHYEAAGDAGFWALDDIKVTASGGPGLPRRNCVNREFVVDAFDSQARSVSMRWKPIAGDEGFRILANGQPRGADLPASAASFTDANPPAGGSIAYSLVSLKAGAAEFQCDYQPISVFACPAELRCCVDVATRRVDLSWRNGANIAGSGWRINRNGVPVTTQPFTADSFVDLTLPAGGGVYGYELRILGGDQAQCPELPLRCTVVIPGADVIYYEDFNCYGSDTDLTNRGWLVQEVGDPTETGARWTLTDPGQRGNPANEFGLPTEGRFLVSDSDASGGDDGQGSGRSHDVLSPSFSCAGKDTVWLHLDCTAVLNNNGVVVFDIDLTKDNGTNWINVFRRVGAARSVEPLPVSDLPDDVEGGPRKGNADGVFGRLHLDISAVAANQANVRLRLRQFEPSDDWWIAVDNLQVDTRPQLGGARTVLAREGFDEDIVPPDGWTSDSLIGGSGAWGAADPCGISNFTTNLGVFPDAADGRQLHHFERHFAQASGSVDEFGFCAPTQQDEILITPPLNLSGTEAVWLHFKSAFVFVANSAQVLLSLDGGATFESEPIWGTERGGGFYRNAGNAEVTYDEYVLPVPRALGQANVAFVFNYKNAGANVAYWAIDDVQVSANGGGVARTRFIRGDCNGDGGTGGVTDAVAMLTANFIGGVTIGCRAACDVNGDGATGGVTDAVALLTANFIGGLTIQAPFPNCGEGSLATDDVLGCETAAQRCR